MRNQYAAISIERPTAIFEQIKTQYYCSIVRWGRENNTQQFPPFTIELSGTTATVEQTDPKHYCEMVRWSRENNTQRFLIELSGPPRPLN